MTTTEALDMIDICYGIRKMYMQVWETTEKMFSIGVPTQELFDWCKHEYVEKDAFLESVMEDFKQVHSAQPNVPDTNVGDMISRQKAIDFIDAGKLCNPNEPRWSDNEVVNFLKSRPSPQPEQDCILKQFGNCSYVETGCSDCVIKAKIRKALSSAESERQRENYEQGYKTGYADALLEVEELCQRKKKLFVAERRDEE